VLGRLDKERLLSEPGDHGSLPLKNERSARSLSLIASKDLSGSQEKREPAFVHVLWPGHERTHRCHDSRCTMPLIDSVAPPIANAPRHREIKSAQLLGQLP
jgi:hypothetical protein